MIADNLKVFKFVLLINAYVTMKNMIIVKKL